MKLKYNDKQHAYWIDGKRAKGVTGIAGIPDDMYGVEKWRSRMIVLGLVERPDLLVKARKNAEDRNEIQDIAEDALRAARAGEKAERGTQLHHILEAYDLTDIAEVTSLVSDSEARAARASWDKALHEAKITLDEDWIERILLFPTQLIAGRMDRFVKVGRAKSHAVLDLKTGKIDYPHKMAIQLACYAHAHLAAGALDEDGVTTDFTELPDMDLKWGLIAHMPTPGEIDIHKIDIAAGWKAAEQICFKTIDWRANKSLLKPFVSVEVVDPEAKAMGDRVADVLGRVKRIYEAGDLAKRLCVNRWPNGVAGPKGSDTWTAGDIDEIERRLETIERDGEVPF